MFQKALSTVMTIFKLLISLGFLLSISNAVFATPKIIFTEAEQQFINAHPTIIVGGESDWPPFDFVINGQHTGAAKDYLDAVSEHTGLKFQVKTGMSWDELLNSLKKQQIDLLPMLYWEVSRVPYMHFTEPYLNIRQYLFTREDRRDIHSLVDLNNKILAVPKGYAQNNVLKDSYPQIHIFEVTSPQEAIDAVITGQADALIENTALVNYYMEENNIVGLHAATATNLGIHKLHMATRKDWPILRDIVQKGLNAITFEEHQRISQKWLEFQPAVRAHSTPQVNLTLEERTYLRNKRRIKACVDPNWMPYEALEEGQHIGMASDYRALFEQHLAIPIEIIASEDWAESIDLAKARKCDMLMLSMNSPERRQFMDLTTPYLHLPVVLATKPEVLFIDNLNDIKRQKIGILKNHAIADLMIDRYPFIDFVPVESIHAGLEMVKQGKLFGFMDTLSAIGYSIQSDFYGLLKIGGKFDFDWQLSIATRNDQPILGHIFEKIVASLTRQQQQSIVNNWVSSIELVHVSNQKLVLQVVAFFSAILIIAVFRNRQLQRHQAEITEKNKALAEINSQLQLQKNEIQHLADHDFLTGLPNRKNFSSLLKHAISIANRKHYSLAVLFLDLDRFKTINDSFGHHVGDEMLKMISQRLQQTLRESDIIARIGGDEFLIILEAIDDYHYPGVVSKKILDTIRQPIIVSEHVIHNTASIGIAFFPDDGKDVNALIKNADSAMYLAKEKGKDNYQYYTYELSAQIERHMFIEHALKHAIDNEELSLLYQPQVDLKTLDIIGVEVLLRWQHPTLGQISPGEFIPIAEDSGTIIELGEWVFKTACEQFAHWQQAGYRLDSLAINVSSVQFNQTDLVERFTKIIDQYAIKAELIEIEITERYVMTHTEKNDRILHALRDNGFRISVDDFGTGYSSMSYLKTLPLDIIKIDKSFIDEIPHNNNDVQITKAILALSHSLGYTVIAEGIENQKQLSMLQNFSCQRGQGYYFSKPLSPDKLASLLDEQQNVTD